METTRETNIDSLKVISIDPNKIWIEIDGEERIFVKKTTQLEFDRLQTLKHWLSKNTNSFLRTSHSVLTIQAPEILSWNSGNQLLKLRNCSGENLEIVLRSTFGDKRAFWVDLINCFFIWARTKGFCWKGVAPRHMIFEEVNKTIFLVDFERPLNFFNRPLSNKEFKAFVRGIVHEEFCAFLFPKEQQKIFGNVWADLPPESVPVSSITSTRQLLLLKALFGEITDYIPINQLAEVERLMSSVVTPFWIDNESFFPLVFLEEIKGGENYVQAVFELQRSKKEQWREILGRRIFHSTNDPLSSF